MGAFGAWKDARAAWKVSRIATFTKDDQSAAVLFFIASWPSQGAIGYPKTPSNATGSPMCTYYHGMPDMSDPA